VLKLFPSPAQHSQHHALPLVPSARSIVHVRHDSQQLCGIPSINSIETTRVAFSSQAFRQPDQASRPRAHGILNHSIRRRLASRRCSPVETALAPQLQPDGPQLPASGTRTAATKNMGIGSLSPF
jgi:hypothetical protein